MIWPPAPTCHANEREASGAEWKTWDTTHARSGLRTCWYCGCIHPADLILLLDTGARMHGADWKYGWPHKFYVVDLPKRQGGQERWYNQHLLDDGYSTEARDQLLVYLERHAGIAFCIDADGRLAYQAPSYGYQR